MGCIFKETEIDEVDKYLASQDGKIQRDRGQLCSHGPRQKCSNCLPIDPYDDAYLKSKDIKHMSFHSYVRKLTDLHGRGTQLKRPLEKVTCLLDLKCTAGHHPYPKGICTKCRPPTLTLNRQPFRHVDNITIENDGIVNCFLDFWRGTSYQRVGYLIGRYEPFPEVPLGIKASVTAIYEPPQSSTESSVQFEEDPQDTIVDKLCSWLEMRRVGWIFTDLWSADVQKGTVHCTRHENSYLLSAQECITAGAFQVKYKNRTEFSSDKFAGSKFVTVVATGDKSQCVNFTGYQVSNQCAAMVEADILCPTSHPELAYTRETPLNDKHYITDVQYTEKNEYGAEVKRNGKPMPVEYLLVDVPAGMPREPHFSFQMQKSGKCFPIENRTLIGKPQDIKTVSQYIHQFSSNQFLELASNFHFLLYLLTNDMLRFGDEEIRELCKIVIEHNREAAANWAENNQNWMTMVELSNAHSDGTTDAGPMDDVQGSSAQSWSCKHCTYVNVDARSDCAICGLPKCLAVFVLSLTTRIYSLTDYTLSCQRGYRVSAIRRSNSFRQPNKAGSLSIECQSILETDLETIACQTLTSTPSCNGQLEGCTANQWLAGFHAYAIENNTNAVLLDPVCCTSPRVTVDSFSCASERINTAIRPFEHMILGKDLVGMQCWHQYNANNSLVDLIWKMEICQLGTNGSRGLYQPGESCPPCDCHCGIDTCGDGREPIRVIHKHFNSGTCGCDCLCRYECI